MPPESRPAAQEDWRRGLRRKVAWLLAAKLAALVALKLVFFPGDARIVPATDDLDGHLGITARAPGEEVPHD